MPRIRVGQEHRKPVSIPGFSDPVCPRCLGIAPGVPGGDPKIFARFAGIAEESKENDGPAIPKKIAIRPKAYPLTALEPKK